MTTYSCMKCPFCNSDTKVYNSRSSHQHTQTWRRRQCLNCNKTFTTREKVDYTGLIEVRSKNSKRKYSRERILMSVARASDMLNIMPEMLVELTDSIELELKNQHFFEIKTQDSQVIVSTCLAVLSRYDKNLAIQYLNNTYRNKPPLMLLSQLLSNK